MAQNKKKRKSKQGADPDAVLLKKLPGLLAICEFILILLLVSGFPVVSPEYHPALDTQESAEAPEESVPQSREIQSPTEVSVSDSISSGEVHIAATTESIPEPKKIMQVTVTAYSSTEDQTDNTPFHTANGNAVRDGIVAANFLSLGTRVRIPEVFGDKIFTVLDRMHERFNQRMDIWMPSRQAAKEFGIRYLTVEIL